MYMLKRIGWIVLFGIILSIPSVVITSPTLDVPFWYLISIYLAKALGAGIWSIFWGVLIILDKRRSLKTAMIVVTIISLVLSYTLIHTHISP
ncbi:MAG: hypothetical protein PHU06_01515 [Gallionella sp.]|nr:hypothetical protein [Gallionella sp.]MDD4957874.1 hypothetical protein [Gallionella sp.]